MKKETLIYILLTLNVLLSFYIVWNMRQHSHDGRRSAEVGRPERIFREAHFTKEQRESIFRSKELMDSLNAPFAEKRKTNMQKVLVFNGSVKEATKDSLLRENAELVYKMKKNLMIHFQAVYNIADEQQKKYLDENLPQFADRFSQPARGRGRGPRHKHSARQ